MLSIASQPGLPFQGHMSVPPIRSMNANGALWVRALACASQIGLDAEQARRLIALNRAFHEESIATQYAFMDITEQLEIKGDQRIDAMAVAERLPLLDQHADLFAQHERLAYEYTLRGMEILTPEQVDAIQRIWEEERARLAQAVAVA